MNKLQPEDYAAISLLAGKLEKVIKASEPFKALIKYKNPQKYSVVVNLSIEVEEISAPPPTGILLNFKIDTPDLPPEGEEGVKSGES